MDKKAWKSIKLIIGNIILFSTFFIGWISFNGSAAIAASFIGWMVGSPIGPLSPYFVIKALIQIDQFTSLFGTSYSLKEFIPYSLLLIPIFSAISIILILLKRKAYWLFSTAGAIVCLLFGLDALYYAIIDPNISVSWGIFIAIATSVWVLIVMIKPTPRSSNNLIATYDRLFKVKRKKW